MNLIRTKIENGTYYAVLTGPETPPALSLIFDGTAIGDVKCVAREGKGQAIFEVEAEVPPKCLGAAITNFTIVENQSGAILDHFAFIADTAYDEALTLRVAQLESEVAVLKRVVRRLTAKDTPS